MEPEAIPVTFLPGEFTVRARVGDTLLDAAIDNGIDLPHECGGNCACTTCHVCVESGAEHLSAMEPVECDRLSTADKRTPKSRLACQALLVGGPIRISPQEIW